MPARCRSCRAWRTSSSSPRTIPSAWPTWSSTAWPTVCHAASGLMRGATCRCSAPCTAVLPGPACSTRSCNRPSHPARPGLPERRYGGRVYRVSDKVTQLRNNYDKKVFNGSMGVVTGLSLEEQELRVFMDETEEITYSFDELDEITHAYAMTVHRAQGSEYPCVVVPLTTSAW